VKPSIKSIAVAGAAGYVGSQISRAVLADGGCRLIPVRRGECPETLFAGADFVIHAANPARRFQAEQNPERDFIETVEKTAGLLAAAQGKPFLLVSSLSCRTQLNLSYGRNRRACELLVLAVGAQVIRLGPLFGGGRVRDVLHDIVSSRPIYVSAETQYAYADVQWIGRRIIDLLGTTGGIVELGARNAVPLGDIAARFTSTSSFEGDEDTQIPLNCPDGPDAGQVIAFAEQERARMAEWL